LGKLGFLGEELKAKGIALINKSTSGAFQSIRVAFVIKGVYEPSSLL
jgi:hypothetical protein